MLSIVTNKFIRKTKIKSVKLALSNNTRTEKKTKEYGFQRRPILTTLA